MHICVCLCVFLRVCVCVCLCVCVLKSKDTLFDYLNFAKNKYFFIYPKPSKGMTTIKNNLWFLQLGRCLRTFG